MEIEISSLDLRYENCRLKLALGSDQANHMKINNILFQNSLLTGQ